MVVGYILVQQNISMENCFFRFKNEWHKGAEFVSNHAEELVEEGGKIFSQSFKH